MPQQKVTRSGMAHRSSQRACAVRRDAQQGRSHQEGASGCIGSYDHIQVAQQCQAIAQVC